jgi:hypothetical protein
LQHCRQIESGPADDLEDVGGSSLLLERLAQQVEQSNVLDGNDRLGARARRWDFISIPAASSGPIPKAPGFAGGYLLWFSRQIS